MYRFLLAIIPLFITSQLFGQGTVPEILSRTIPGVQIKSMLGIAADTVIYSDTIPIANRTEIPITHSKLRHRETALVYLDSVLWGNHLGDSRIDPSKIESINVSKDSVVFMGHTFRQGYIHIALKEPIDSRPELLNLIELKDSLFSDVEGNLQFKINNQNIPDNPKLYYIDLKDILRINIIPVIFYNQEQMNLLNEINILTKTKENIQNEEQRLKDIREGKIIIRGE